MFYGLSQSLVFRKSLCSFQCIACSQGSLLMAFVVVEHNKGWLKVYYPPWPKQKVCTVYYGMYRKSVCMACLYAVN